MKHMNMFLGTIASILFTAGVAHAQTAWNDNQILGLVHVANNGEVSAGRVAVDKGQDDDVQKFGAKMAAHHTANNAKIDVLELKTSLKREESPASKDFEDRANASVDNLKNAKAADFDKAYIDSQVMMHQELLTSLDQALIPAAQNADLKSFLQETRDDVASHLQEAQQIQAKLAQ